jgi:membrane protein
MPAVSVSLALIIFAAGTIAGSLGALLGLGGGVFLVPFLNLVMGFPFSAAAAISLTTVIATSSTVSAGRAGKHLISLYIGSSNMASTYGAAGALIVLLLWIFYSSQIFLLGAEFTRAWASVYGSHRSHGPTD